jgi:hypothetical protein
MILIPKGIWRLKMKKASMFTVFIMIASLLITTVAFANDSFDPYANFKADFKPYRDPDGYGYVVVNYVKGQDVWNFSGEVWNLNEDCGTPSAPKTCTPLDTFTIKVGIAGDSVNQTPLVTFTVDENGYASFSGQVLEVQDPFNYIRVVPYGAHTIIGTGAAGIKYRGSGRMQNVDGRWHD